MWENGEIISVTLLKIATPGKLPGWNGKIQVVSGNPQTGKE
jgi:hypothetical protein